VTRRLTPRGWPLCGAGLLLVATTAVGAPVGPSQQQAAYPLVVIAAKTPKLHPACRAARIQVSGTYLQVAHEGIRLRKVNAALRRAALDDQKSLLGQKCPQIGSVGPGPAIYAPRLQRRLVSASSVVVSALMPAASLPPGANFSYGWAAVTILVSNAERVTVVDLFQHPKKGLSLVAAASRSRLLAGYACARNYLNLAGLEPEARNFRFFALTSRGLVIGFSAGSVAPQICGALHVTLPYALFRSTLSRLGREVISGIRQPLPS